MVTIGSHETSSISILIQRHLFLFIFCNCLKYILQQKGTLSKAMSQLQCSTMKGKQSKLLLWIPEWFLFLKMPWGFDSFWGDFWYQQFLLLKILIRAQKKYWLIEINRNIQTPHSAWHHWPFLKLRKVMSLFISVGFKSHSICQCGSFLSQAKD